MLLHRQIYLTILFLLCIGTSGFAIEQANDSDTHKPKIAVCYWGLTRSTKQVYQSHFDKLFDVLDAKGLDYDVFMHTWYMKGKQRVNYDEIDQAIDYDEYKLLKPNYYKIENQDQFTDSLDFTDYFYQDVWDWGGNSPDAEWPFTLILNHLCALESKKRVTNMVIESPNDYDLIIYVRPDVMLYDPLDIDLVLDVRDGDIILPNFAHGEGYNDRCAVLTYNTAPIYSHRIDRIADFRKHHGRIVSEKYVKFICESNGLNVRLMNFNFDLIRP